MVPLLTEPPPCGCTLNGVLRSQLQNAMQQLQAANVPEAGLQEFEAQWTARLDARQSAAPMTTTSWTYYSPQGEEVKGVPGIIKIISSRLMGVFLFGLYCVDHP